jgi:hypothetical protein
MLSEIENGKKDGSVRTPAALARTLGLGLDDLVSRSRHLELQNRQRSLIA